MKRNGIKKLILALSLSLSLILTTSVYAEDLPQKSDTDTSSSSLIQSSDFKVDKKIIERLKAEKAAQQANNKNKSDEVTAMAPAPPLTYLEVCAAISSNYPQYEYFDDYQFSSIEDHGGAEVYIVTAELGYGYSRFAKMNGTTLQSIQSQSIDLEGDSIIDGWYYWWDASAFENGNFTYQNTSSNSPWNTMSDSIYIK